MAQSKCQRLVKILLLAAVTLVWMHNPPKKPTCCWTMSQIPKPRVAGSACVHGLGFWGQYPPATRTVDEYTRGLERMSLVTASRLCYCRKPHVISSINSLGRWYSPAPAPLIPSWLFVLYIHFLLYYLSTYRHAARSSFHHGAISSKCSSKNSIFSPLSFIWSSSFTHKEENYLPLLLEQVGELAFVGTTKSLPWLLWAYNT